MNCTHNTMIERVGDARHAWQCADCGYVYGDLPGIGRRQQPNSPHTFTAPVQATGDDFTLTREVDRPADETTPDLFEEKPCQ